MALALELVPYVALGVVLELVPCAALGVVLAASEQLGLVP